MKTLILKVGYALALTAGGALITAPVMADKPEWAGAGKRGTEERGERSDGDRRDRDYRAGERQRHFDDHHRVVVREYYEEQFRRGHCPPGLAKKHNGCMPPAQARKWQYGRPLPRDVVFYEVPRDVVVRIGAPPPGHRYVRVGSDILLLAIGTNMVIDAIENLSR